MNENDLNPKPRNGNAASDHADGRAPRNSEQEETQDIDECMGRDVQEAGGVGGEDDTGGRMGGGGGGEEREEGAGGGGEERDEGAEQQLASAVLTFDFSSSWL